MEVLCSDMSMSDDKTPEVSGVLYCILQVHVWVVNLREIGEILFWIY